MKTERWGLAFAGLGPLFAAWPGLASPYTLPKLLILAIGTAVAGLAATQAVAPGKRAPATSAPDLLAPLGAVLLSLAFAAAFSADPAASLLGEYSQRSQGLLSVALFAALVALAQGAGAASAAWLLSAGAAAGAVLAVFGLLQLVGLDPVLNAIGELTYGRTGSLTGSPIGFGACLAMLLPLQLREALDASTPIRRRLGLALLILGIAGLITTWSRGAWLAATAGLTVYAYWTGRLSGPRSRRALAAVVLAVAVAGGALALVTGKIRPTAGSDRGRLAVWRGAWAMFVSHPVLGVGPETFDLMLGRYKGDGFVRAYGASGGQAHAHNDLLESLAVSGFIGFAAYAWLSIAAWRRLRHALLDDRRRADAAAAGAGLLAAFLIAKVNPLPLDALALAALLLGLMHPSGRRSSGLLSSTRAIGITGALITAWLSCADRQCLRGMSAQNAGRLAEAREHYAAAVRLDPFQARYGFWLVGAIRAQARAETAPDRKRELGRDAVEAARPLAARHPHDVRAWHALGGSLAALTLQGGPDAMAQAAEALDRGVLADWSYRPLLETRLTVASLRGDVNAKGDSTRRLARLDALDATGR